MRKMPLIFVRRPILQNAKKMPLIFVRHDLLGKKCYQRLPEAIRGRQKPPEATSGDFWQFLAVAVAASGGCWRLLAAAGGCWRLLAVAGGFWLLLLAVAGIPTGR